MTDKFVNPEYGSKAPVNDYNATHNGESVFCPINAYGDCPYCDQCNLCHMSDPMDDCDDFAIFFESWDAWEALNEPDTYTKMREGFNEFEANP